MIKSEETCHYFKMLYFGETVQLYEWLTLNYPSFSILHSSARPVTSSGSQPIRPDISFSDFPASNICPTTCLRAS